MTSVKRKPTAVADTISTDMAATCVSSLSAWLPHARTEETVWAVHRLLHHGHQPVHRCNLHLPFGGTIICADDLRFTRLRA